MSVLVDWQIRQLCLESKMIDPFREDLLNPQSLDVVVGNTAAIEVRTGFFDRILGQLLDWLDPDPVLKMEESLMETIDLSDYSETNPYWIKPGEFLLVATRETFNLPPNIGCEFRLKSSRAREGYNQSLAVWADGGFHNSKLTLELQNLRRWKSLPLYPDMKIGQLIFHQTEHPTVSYAATGRYNGDQTVMVSKG